MLVLFLKKMEQGNKLICIHVPEAAFTTMLSFIKMGASGCGYV
jgi:hypothetical protein